MGRWKVWVDTGGTFTDCLALDPAGELRRAKVLSTGAMRFRARPDGAAGLRLGISDDFPEAFFAGCRARRLGDPRDALVESHRGTELTLAAPLPGAEAEVEASVEIEFGEEAPIVAARCVTATPRLEPLPELEMRLATTRGTNALLERRGDPVALFVTAGFGDLLVIGDQRRDELFTLRPARTPPLYVEVVEVDERLAANGSVLRAPDLEAIASTAASLRARGVDRAAVALLHAYRFPEHEDRVADVLRRLGFVHVSRSADLAPRIQILPRAETAVVDAYLSGVVGGYLETVGAAVGGRLQVMTSAGGLVRAAEFRAKDSLLSGPAGGVVGAVQAGMRAGCQALLAFDMGGTSTDVSRWGGELDYRFETRVGSTRLMAPGLAIETVAAGGGSICAWDGSRLTVGPRSAGARPGPACYGAGGPLTLTDVNLLLGRLDPSAFRIPVDPAAAARAASALLAGAAAPGEGLEPLLGGLLRIADERMAEAIRKVSLRRGYSPAEHTLVAFGGAGGQHGCAVAALLDIERVLVPTDAGLLSAVGLRHARVERFAERQILAPAVEVLPDLADELAALEAEALSALEAEGIEAADAEVRRRLVEMRLVGQEAVLAVEASPGTGALETRFAAAYRALYGYPPPDRPVEVVALRVVASSRSEVPPAVAEPGRVRAPSATRRLRSWFAGKFHDSAVFDRQALGAGDGADGPALVVEAHGATVVPPGWSVRVDAAGALRLRSGGGRE